MKRFSLGVLIFLILFVIACSNEKRIIENGSELTNADYDTIAIPPLPNLVDADYIYITNGNQSIGVQRLRVGDEFLGLHLCEILLSSVIYIDNEFYEHWQTMARFSGELVLGGDLHIVKDYQAGFEAQIFSVHEDYLDILPWLAKNSVEVAGFDISNYEDLFKFLGLSEDDFAPIMSLVVPDLVIIIEDLELVHMRTSIYNSARIVSLLEN